VVCAFLAAGPGFSFGDAYPFALLFVGLAIFVAIGALSHAHERSFSASLIYLGLGFAAAAIIGATGVSWFDPIDDADLLERLTEIALIVALFSAGLKLDRPLGWRSWASVARLLVIVMPLSIAAIAAFGHFAMDLTVGAAIVLGAALAPTDPVLAGDIGVGPPGEEDEREPNFSLTAEAGLNDGLASPFILIGVLLASRDGTGWIREWVFADVLYAVLVGIAIGAVAGYAFAAGLVRLRERRLLNTDYDGWVAVAAVLAIYGLSELASVNGFLAAFAGGLAFRRYERDHELNARVHNGAETVEKFAELTVILLLGSMMTLDGLANPGWSGWLLAPLLLLLIRPVAVALAFARSGVRVRDRVFVGWFGVRGVGSVYYAVSVVALGSLLVETQTVLFWTVAVCVLVSIVVHGATGTPGLRMLERAARGRRLISMRRRAGRVPDS
jgi:sodium/hydrogen antiporter